MMEKQIQYVHLYLTNFKGEFKEFPLRLLLTDADGDGNPEVMTSSHREAAGRIFQKFRSLGKGKITRLSWNGLGLSPVWTTLSLGGRISDFAVGDVDNDGKEELVRGAAASPSPLSVYYSSRSASHW